MLSFILCHTASNAQEKMRVCYFANWAQHRPAPMQFVPEDVDPFLCTHIMYAFAGMEGNQLSPIEPNDETIGNVTGM